MPKKRERYISFFLSFYLSEKEISLFQSLQVLLDYGALGNKSDTKKERERERERERESERERD